MLRRLTKSVDVRPDIAENGTITGYASTFTREPDWAGDVVARGAFADWLDAYKASGTTLPLLYKHDQSLDGFIGKVTSIAEDEHGLLFTAEFDATERAQRARELAMDGRLAKFSFAYAVRDQCNAPRTAKLPQTKTNNLTNRGLSPISNCANGDTVRARDSDR